MRLADPQKSRAVLIGTSAYRHMPAIPAVAKNLDTLQRLLIDSEIWGLPSENCRVVMNPATVADVIDPIHEAMEAASEALIVYYAGHGIRDPEVFDDLYLGLPDSDSEHLYRSVPFNQIRRALSPNRGPAAKVVILDCCYSGIAIGAMGPATDMADQAMIKGTYLMTATSQHLEALAPVGADYTVFTGELIRALEEGIPGKPDLLDLDTLYFHLRGELRAQNHPIPQQRNRDEGSRVTIARNRLHTAPGRMSPPAADPLASPPPSTDPLVKWSALRRLPPREIMAQAQRLDAVEAADLFRAAGMICADQIVASLLALLNSVANYNFATQVHAGVMVRPPREILAVVAALNATGQEQQITLLLESSRSQSRDEVIALASALHAEGMQAYLTKVLDGALTLAAANATLVELTTAMRASTLADDIEGMFTRAADRVPPAELAQWADGLHDAGYEDLASRLYQRSAAVIALRSASKVAQVASIIHKDGQPNQAIHLIDLAYEASVGVVGMAELIAAMFQHGPDTHADHVVTRCARSMGVLDLIEIAAELREHNHDASARALLLCGARLGQFGGTAVLAERMRDGGRPIDARNVIEVGVKYRPAEEIIVALVELSGLRALDEVEVIQEVVVASDVAVLGAVLEAGGRAGALHILRPMAAAVVRQRSEADLAVLMPSLLGIGHSELIKYMFDDPSIGRKLEGVLINSTVPFRRHILVTIANRSPGSLGSLLRVTRVTAPDVARMLVSASSDLPPEDCVAVIHALQGESDRPELHKVLVEVGRRPIATLVHIIQVLVAKEDTEAANLIVSAYAQSSMRLAVELLESRLRRVGAIDQADLLVSDRVAVFHHGPAHPLSSAVRLIIRDSPLRSSRCHRPPIPESKANHAYRVLPGLDEILLFVDLSLFGGGRGFLLFTGYEVCHRNGTDDKVVTRVPYADFPDLKFTASGEFAIVLGGGKPRSIASGDVKVADVIGLLRTLQRAMKAWIDSNSIEPVGADEI
ncbi:hypothetical protein F4553_007882 [Allocatelliglobosispora scoriae]|uniref:Peptidase C14 caspase domain-containing protein n=1 Tax=Allocatelliglobosispora scoriae TaxID=643052 RepID=A0A841C3V8_9ACTN|nr:caspase family protein [Allocatelliglobosispora scoriae]MBB5874448.1 hypothetical protein [Allocatelliglobosispora scoriae]